jgi:hypothetical protein
MNHTFSGLSGLWAATKSTFKTTYADADAMELLKEPVKPMHAFNPLVQIHPSKNQMEETRA